jgi:hypothetical protein
MVSTRKVGRQKKWLGQADKDITGLKMKRSMQKANNTE